ncbi:hypothetical protein PMAYCL1PPCAC_12025 [Pristionchus mayeri]|uniref:Uncharacterized protein n=1 Tax=Pristionchus mayeri TaxID=1317129 RepID=A0AAN4ZQC0_9BILA|nr:hypothetical protein PMAYCL1PPCAC_12025 [Pristionchus mayeri]
MMSSQWGVFSSYCNSTRATIANPARSALVLDDAFSCALLRSYLYFSAIVNSPRCLLDGHSGGDFSCPANRGEWTSRRSEDEGGRLMTEDQGIEFKMKIGGLTRTTDTARSLRMRDSEEGGGDLPMKMRRN